MRTAVAADGGPGVARRSRWRASSIRSSARTATATPSPAPPPMGHGVAEPAHAPTDAGRLLTTAAARRGRLRRRQSRDAPLWPDAPVGRRLPRSRRARRRPVTGALPTVDFSTLRRRAHERARLARLLRGRPGRARRARRDHRDRPRRRAPPLRGAGHGTCSSTRRARSAGPATSAASTSSRAGRSRAARSPGLLRPAEPSARLLRRALQSRRVSLRHLEGRRALGRPEADGVVGGWFRFPVDAAAPSSSSSASPTSASTARAPTSTPSSPAAASTSCAPPRKTRGRRRSAASASTAEATTTRPPSTPRSTTRSCTRASPATSTAATTASAATAPSVDADHPRYHVFGLWDTYRTVHPLLALVYPECSERWCARSST